MNTDNNVIYTNQTIEENGLASTLTFKGTLGGEEKGEVKLACTQFYNNLSDLTILQISSIQAKILSGAGIPSGKSYWVYGNLIIKYVDSNGEEILNKIEFSDANTSTLKFSSLDTYYNLTDNNGVSHSLSIEIPASSTVKKVEIKLEKTGSNSGFLFYETNSTPEYHWNILPANGAQEIELITNNQENPSLPEHISSFDVKSLLMGWCFARAIFQTSSPQSEKPSPGPEPEAVVYLYNGVRLPKLPEWDKETYPYVFIYKTATMFEVSYVLHLTPNPYYAVSDNGKYCIGYRSDDISYMAYDDSDVFGYKTNYISEGIRGELDNVVWANFDVLDENGELLLPASEPIPVYG